MASMDISSWGKCYTESIASFRNHSAKWCLSLVPIYKNCMCIVSKIHVIKAVHWMVCLGGRWTLRGYWEYDLKWDDGWGPITPLCISLQEMCIFLHPYAVLNTATGSSSRGPKLLCLTISKPCPFICWLSQVLFSRDRTLICTSGFSDSNLACQLWTDSHGRYSFPPAHKYTWSQ